MNQPAAPARDTRLDVLRAIALLTIFINHVPGNVFEHFTHKNFGFSDSAEAFVLISGIAVGLAYGLKFEPGRQLLLTLKAWRRAAVLYLTHVVTTVATLAIFAAAAIWYQHPKLLEMINIGPVVADTPATLVGLATFGHQLGYNNILSMYAVVLLMLPLFLFVGRHSLLAMVGLSGAIWLVCGLAGIAPPNYPNEGVWFLNPLSWQFLFVIGIAALLHVRRGGSLAFSPILGGIAAAYLLLAAVWVNWPLWGLEKALDLPALLGGFEKTYLSLPRLLHVLAAAYLVVTIPAIGNLARTSQTNPLAILGKHSLPVFVAGTLLAMVGQVMTTVYDAGLAFGALLIVAGVALQFALAYWLEWLPSIGWNGKKAPPAPVAAAAKPAKAQPSRQPAMANA
jgi:hypothetical protein